MTADEFAACRREVYVACNRSRHRLVMLQRRLQRRIAAGESTDGALRSLASEERHLGVMVALWERLSRSLERSRDVERESRSVV